MAQFARPNQDIATGSWTKSGGTYWYENIDEVIQNGDTDFCSCPNGGGTLEVKLSSVSDPGVGTSHVLRLYAKAPGGGGAPEKLDIDLYQGGTLIAHAFANLAINRTAYTLYEYTLTEAQANAITDYSDLRIKFIEATVGAGEEIRVTQAELEVPEANVVVSPSPASIATSALIGAIILGAVSITPAPAIVATEAINPTVIQGSIILTPAPASMTISAIDPAVELSSVTVSPSPASATLSAVNPTVIQGSIVLTPAFASVSLTAIDPTVIEGGGDVFVTPAPAQLSCTAINPTVILSSVVITPGSADLGCSAVNPTVILGNITVIPPPAVVSTSALNPVIILGDIIISPAVAEITVSAINPTVIQGSIILTPAFALMTTSAINPTIIQGSIVVTPAFASVLLTAIDPTVINPGGGNITFDNEMNLSHIYTYDASSDTWSSNKASSSIWDYFSDDAEINDCIYFGWSQRWGFHDLKFYVGTPLLADSITLVWEYHGSGGWAALPNLVDNTNSFQNSGENWVTFDVPTNMQTKSLNNVYAHWVRCRIININNPTEGGNQSVQVVKAKDFGVRVVGYSEEIPATLTDIYNADVSGGWGVVTKVGRFYQVGCNFYIGDGTIISYFQMKTEGLQLKGGLELKSNCKFKCGYLIDLDKRTTKDGGFIYFENIYNTNWFTTYGGSQCFYNSVLKGNGYLYSVVHLISSNVDDMCLLNAGDSVIERVKIQFPGSHAIDGRAGAFKDIFVHDSDRAFRTPGGVITHTISNLKVRNTTYIFMIDGCPWTGWIKFIDTDTDTWDIKWNGINSTGIIYEQYTLNLQVIDKDNNPINGAVVTLKDKDDVQIFSVTTGLDGKIIQQTVTAKERTWASGTHPGITTITDKNPFTLTVNKENYWIYQTKFDLTKKIDCIIALPPYDTEIPTQPTGLTVDTPPARPSGLGIEDPDPAPARPTGLTIEEV